MEDIATDWSVVLSADYVKSSPRNLEGIYGQFLVSLRINNLECICADSTRRDTSRPANRPAFGGTVPLVYQMSRVSLNHGNVPLFVRSRFFLRNAAAVPRR